MDLPLYNPTKEDKEFPEAAKTFKQALVEADGMFITGPEYNGFISPLLLNAITWATRGEGNMYAGFKGKIVGLMGTSPGAMGGMRMLRSFATFLSDMGATVVPGHNAVGRSHQVMKDGKVVDERTQSKIDAACGQLVHFARYEVNRERDCKVYEEYLNQTTMGEYGAVDN